MSGEYQLDLFDVRPEPDRPSSAAVVKPVSVEGLSDEGLISAIPDASLADVSALAGEAGRRRLGAAVPVLVSLCCRFVGFGSSVVVPEQVAAIEALGAIGTREAARAVSDLITRQVIQGPTLITALTASAQLGVVLPNSAALSLLRDSSALVRAAACGCVRAGHEIASALILMMSDPDMETAIAAACALGRMGRGEALGPLKRYLVERPSRRIVAALAVIADDAAVVLLARTGRTRRELTGAVISALEDVESPRALAAAEALKILAPKGA